MSEDTMTDLHAHEGHALAVEGMWSNAGSEDTGVGVSCRDCGVYVHEVRHGEGLPATARRENGRLVLVIDSFGAETP